MSQTFEQCRTTDKTLVKSTLLSSDKNILSRDMSFMSGRSDYVVTLYILKLQCMYFQFDYLCSVAT